ncbi:hypothetical protein V565_071490 [Rhizoctonia solani 123E]|uniref:F-box-like domain protein n=1 Tax=Rhizoctonia solani 123E TaxID=1423351 RepID=A0A074RUV8_9AGAM|nr:hypothetical protein V565_071490 [Rhizoctonia solani 123E]
MHLQIVDGSRRSDEELPGYIKLFQQILMHVPNITRLRLALAVNLDSYLINKNQYPFKLRRLTIMPSRNTALVEFLKTQPEIEEITFEPYLAAPPRWHVDGPLRPDILPKLRTIHAPEVDISFMVPHHPVSSVIIFGTGSKLEVHNQIAKSSAPLQCLREHINLDLWKQQPWGTWVVSQGLASLEFCWTSLTNYTLDISAKPESILSLLKESDTPSHGFDVLRRNLSAFIALKRFTLVSFSDRCNDLIRKFRETIPELSRFDVWQESCPSLEEIRLFGITLRKT